MVSATDQQMAPGALYDCNKLDCVRFEISLFIAFLIFSALVVLRGCFIVIIFLILHLNVLDTV